jgi:A/G-specific adenine glycosylase
MSRAKPARSHGSSASGFNDAQVRRALLRWFRIHRRPLPWRASRDPYKVWVSEVMLQQTQIATVIPFYERFLDAFATVDTLARAPLERVLRLWSGLGYYRRARQLHAAAKIIVEQFHGRFPAGPGQARELPGVGDYTAAAVLSIAYGVPLAALDGNVARVVARLSGLAGSLAQREFRGAVKGRLDRLLSRRRPGDFNQALMELGQTVCVPRAPRCPCCPLRAGCRASTSGRPEAFPSTRPRRAAEESHLAAALILRPAALPGGESHQGARPVLLTRGLDDGLMADLWNFPSAFGTSAAQARARLENRLAGLGGSSASLGAELARVSHNVTYRRIRVRVYRASPLEQEPEGSRWLRLSRFRHAAVSQLARKIANAAEAALN